MYNLSVAEGHLRTRRVCHVGMGGPTARVSRHALVVTLEILIIACSVTLTLCYTQAAG